MKKVKVKTSGELWITMGKMTIFVDNYVYR